MCIYTHSISLLTHTTQSVVTRELRVPAEWSLPREWDSRTKQEQAQGSLRCETVFGQVNVFFF